MRKIRTYHGITWDEIAIQHLGDELLVSDLMLLNREYVGTVFFPAGVYLKLPEPRELTNLSLPPWKRGVSVAR